MNNERYEPIKFDSWRELTKFVIDGGEVYVGNGKEKIEFFIENSEFSHYFSDWVTQNLYIKRQLTLTELIEIKPRLCWVLSNTLKVCKLIIATEYYVDYIAFIDDSGKTWVNAEMLSDDEIKEFLN